MVLPDNTTICLIHLAWQSILDRSECCVDRLFIEYVTSNCKFKQRNVDRKITCHGQRPNLRPLNNASRNTRCFIQRSQIQSPQWQVIFFINFSFFTFTLQLLLITSPIRSLASLPVSSHWYCVKQGKRALKFTLPSFVSIETFMFLRYTIL